VNVTGPFKAEWATLKDESLYVGAFGKEWIDNGAVTHRDYLWVKQLTPFGLYHHHNWTGIYEKLREKSNATFPGYLIHEAVAWDFMARKWVFVPRKVSRDVPYAEDTDERLSGNLMFIVSEDLTEVELVELGVHDPLWGFSDIKVLPRPLQHLDQPALILGIRVTEVEGVTGTQMAVFDTKGRFYTNPPFLPFKEGLHHLKFEGLAFLPMDRQAAMLKKSKTE